MFTIFKSNTLSPILLWTFLQNFQFVAPDLQWGAWKLSYSKKFPCNNHDNHDTEPIWLITWDRFHWILMPRLQDADTSNTMLQLVPKSMALKMNKNKSHLTFSCYDHGNHHRARDEFHWMPMLRLQDTDTSNTMLQLVFKSLAPKMDENKSVIKELQVYGVFLVCLS